MKRGEWIFMGKAGRSWVSLHSVSGSVGHTVWGITRVVTPTKVTTKHGSTELTIPRMGTAVIIIIAIIIIIIIIVVIIIIIMMGLH